MAEHLRDADGVLKRSYTLGVGDTSVEITPVHGPDWFPVRIGNHCQVETTLFLRRSELRAWRDALDEIDRLAGVTALDELNELSTPATELPAESPYWGIGQSLMGQQAA